MLRKNRITVQGYFIIGFPFENKEYITDTVKFAIKANPHFANFSHFVPIVGTPIYEKLQEEGSLWINNGEVDDGFFRANTYFDNPNITPEEMTKMYAWAWRKFYFRPYKVFDMLFSIKSLKEFTWVFRVATSLIRNKLLKH